MGERMNKEDVPQDDGINNGIGEINYAVDSSGRYVQVSSLGWEPKNTANEQAWGVIEEDIVLEIKRIQSGKRSPLAYHMVKHLMDVALLSDYAQLPKRQVKRHLTPQGFNALAPELLERYADIFGITAEQLQQVPDISDPFYDNE
jgi:hypothetical protein